MFKRCLLAMLAILTSIFSTFAQDTVIRGDPGAPLHQQPQIINTAGGMHQVNINTPNATGLSYNRYQQFDVGRQGAILNNSTASAQTQLGGWIERNPNLAGGSARAILNEVNSSQPSQLGGYLEVAGQRADVIIANPSGINVDGFGYINANRGVLTTGVPVLDASGNLSGYRVSGGQINVAGAGLDASSTSYTDIISQSASLNAGVWANNLQVIAGNNSVSYDGAMVTPLGENDPTGVSIDVSQLGGMYAGHIKLVGTSKGVGVHNAGSIVAQAGEVVITADGRLESSGLISGQGSVRAEIRGDIVNTGRMQSGGEVRLLTHQFFDNQGDVVANDGVVLSADRNFGNSGLIHSKSDMDIAAKQGSFFNTGEMLSGGFMDIHADQDFTNGGEVQSQSGMSLQSATGVIDNSGILATGGVADIVAAVDIINTGELKSVGSLSMQALSGSIDNQSDILTDGDLTLHAKQDLLNTGDLQSGGKIDLAAEDGLLHNSGELQAAGGFDLNAKGDFENSGTIESGGDLNIASETGSFVNSGELLSNAALNLSSKQDFSNSGDIQAVNGVSIHSQDGVFSNSNRIISNGATAIDSRGDFFNRGVMENLGDLSISSRAGAFDNLGDIITAGKATVSTMGGFANSTLLQSGEALAITAGTTFANAGNILSGAGVTVLANDNIANSGLLQGREAVVATSSEGGIANSGSLLSNAAINLTGKGNFQNDGHIQGLGAVTIVSRTGSFGNTDKILSNASVLVSSKGDLASSGLIQGLGNLNLLSAAGAVNNSGDILSGGAVGIASHADLKTSGAVQGRGELTLVSAIGVFENHGEIFSETAIAISSELFFLSTGRVKSLGNLVAVSNQGAFTNQGEILSGGNVMLTGKQSFTSAGLIQSLGDLSLTSREGTFTATADILANGTLSISSQQDFNSSGLIQGLGELSIASSFGRLINSGSIVSNNLATLSGQGDFKTTGLIQALGTLTLRSAAGSFENDGQILTNQSLSISAPVSFANAGQLEAGGALAITTTDSATNTGGIRAGGDVELLAGGSISSSGSLQSRKNVVIAARGGDLTIEGSVIVADDADLSTSGKLVNQGGNLSVGRRLRASVVGDIANSGTMVADENFITAGGLFKNSGIVDGGLVVLKVDSLENVNTGTILGDHLAVQARSILNGLPIGVNGQGTSGLLGARERLDLGAATIINREDGLIYSGDDLYIGGSLNAQHQATGSAARVTNSSAFIDAGGDALILAAQFENLNPHYATELRVVKEYDKTGYRLDGKPLSEVWDPNTDATTSWGGGDEATIHGEQTEDFFIHESHVIEKDTFVTASRPGYVLAGGNLTIDGSVTNNKSRIQAGGTFTTTGSLNNIGATARYVVSESGTFVWTHVEASGWFGGDHEREYDSEQLFNPGDIITTYDKPVVFNNPVSQNVPVQTVSGQASVPGVLSNASGDALAGGQSQGLQNASLQLQDSQSPANSVKTGIGSGTGSAPSVDLNSIVNMNFNSNLYNLNPAPTSSYLIESNPRLTSYRTWLGSDFMLERMNADPVTIQKRLGDGFYEQRLIREQVNQLTGLRYLDAYESDEEQYRALMIAGVEFAKQFNLVPGLTLSAELMARMTSDIVWLEYVTVDTPEGPRQVLAPKVYLTPGREGMIDPGGTLIAAKKVVLDLSGDFNNSGSVFASESVNVSATNINNSGLIAGQLISLASLKDLSNIGGVIKGVTLVDLRAGNDLTIASSTGGSTNSVKGFNGTNSYLDRLGSVSVTGKDGVLNMSAGRDLNFSAASVDSAGSATLVAGRNINVGTVQVGYDYQSTVDEKNNSSFMEQTDVGSVLSASSGLALKAGEDLTVTGSSLLSDGHLSLQAGGAVSLVEGRAKSSVEDNIYNERHGTFSSKTTTIKSGGSSDIALGSEVSGASVSITSGKDTVIRGSSVAASEGLAIVAGGNVTISGAENSSSTYRDKKDTREGFSASIGTSGVGVSYGSSETGTSTSAKETWVNPSLVGSEYGDVTLYAGKDLTVSGSNVVAGTGDILASGENVTIDNQYDTYDHKDREYSKSTSIGLTLGLTGGIKDVVDKVSGAVDLANKTTNAGSDRAQALYGIAAAREGYDAAKGLVDLAKGGGGFTDVGVSLRLGFSDSSSESGSESHQEKAVGSHLTSGGDTTLVARGKDVGDGSVKSGTGDLNIIGSTVEAGGKVTLAANNDLNLLSAKENDRSSDYNESSELGIGIGVGVSTKGFGITADGSYNESSGKGSGSSTTHAETIISGANGVDFASVGDTTIKGGQLFGKTIVGTVGGDLSIESEQDTASQHRDQSSTGVSLSVTVGPGNASASGSFSTQKQTGDSDYKSVNEQSGIFAGDGGFDIVVGGNTGLKGGVIASKSDPDNNLLSTGTLTTEDIANESNYNASSKGFGIEFGNGKGSISPSLPMKENGGEVSTTKSAISPGTVSITDEQGQLAKTGQPAEQTIAGLNRDVDKAHPGLLERSPDLQGILDNQAELADAAGAAGKAVATTVGDVSQSMYNKTGDDGWKEGGVYKTILQGAGAALVAQLGNGEGLNAALGAMASQLAAGKVGDVADELASNMTSDPYKQEVLSNLIVNVISGGLGYAVGGESGSFSAAYMDRNNRQLHPNEIERILSDYHEFMEKYNATRGDLPPMSEEEAIAFLAQEALRLLDHNWSNLLSVDSSSDPSYSLKKDLATSFYSTSVGNTGKMFTLNSPADFFDSGIGGDVLNESMYNIGKYADFYKNYVDSGITNSTVEQKGTSAQWYVGYEERHEEMRDRSQLLLSFLPIIGESVDISELALRLKNGENIDLEEYAWLAAGILPFGDAAKFLKKSDVISDAAKVTDKAGNVVDNAHNTKKVVYKTKTEIASLSSEELTTEYLRAVANHEKPTYIGNLYESMVSREFGYGTVGGSQRVVTLKNGTIAKFYPDVIPHETSKILIESKHVIKVKSTDQLKAYIESIEKPTLIVHPGNIWISPYIQREIKLKEGIIEVFDPVTKQFKKWPGNRVKK